MLFDDFSKYLHKLDKISSRLEMTEVLAQLYSQLDSQEIVVASYLLQGNLFPIYQSLEFNMSAKSLLKVLASSFQKIDNNQAQTLFGMDDQMALHEVTKLHRDLGDIGDTALEIYDQLLSQVESRNNKQIFTITLVHQQLVNIAQLSGTGSQALKQQNLQTLLESVSSVSAKYLARLVVGKLRLGFSTMTMLDALSWCKHKTKKDSKDLELIYQQRADVGVLAQNYLAHNISIEELKKDAITMFIPVVPALCQRLNSAQEIIEKMGEVIVEPKYDGLRVQIHLERLDLDSRTLAEAQPNSSSSSVGKVKVFSRSLEDITHMFPETQFFAKNLSIKNCKKSCILDAEVIGYDFENQKFLPFQETITRKRKHDVAQTAQAVPVKFLVFDVLYLDGRSLLTKPLLERKSMLDLLILEDLSAGNLPLSVVETFQTNIAIQVHQKHEHYLASGLEGAVIKQVSSVYQPGRKGWSWVKIKESEGTLGKLADTLDVVVMGYYFGRGKRSQFGLGAVLVGVRNGEQVVSVAKVGTGMSEQQLLDLKVILDRIETKKMPINYQVSKELHADVWVLPDLVLEIAGDEITQSSNHSSGLALRFPRLIRLRDDKRYVDANTIEDLKTLRDLS